MHNRWRGITQASLILLHIVQLLGMGLIADLELLLQRQTLILLGTLLRHRGKGNLLERISLQPGLVLQLQAVTQALNPPGQCRRTTGHQGQQHDDSEQTVRRRDQV